MDTVKRENKRIFGYDVLRILATIFAMTVHSMWYCGFYNQPINSIGNFVTMLFSDLTCNLPLLLYVSGCVLRNRKPTRMHYFGAVRLFIGYLLSIITVILCRVYLFDGPGATIAEILNFSLPYCWYISMYLGIFILAPFLNMLYNVLSERQRTLLLVTFGVLTIVPTMFNIYNPITNEALFILYPNWWEQLYPITFYYIGIWLADHDFKIRKRTWLLILIASVIVETFILCFINGFGPAYVTPGDQLGNKRTIFRILNSVCIFYLCKDISVKNDVVRKIGETMSQLTLEVFIISIIFDYVIYLVGIPKFGIEPFFGKLIIGGGNYAWLILSIPFDYLLACLVALPINWATKKICKPLNKLYKKYICGTKQSGKELSSQ